MTRRALGAAFLLALTLVGCGIEVQYDYERPATERNIRLITSHCRYSTVDDDDLGDRKVWGADCDSHVH